MAAVAFTFIKATPYSLVYKLDVGTVNTRTFATMDSDFGTVNGPLRALLTRVNAAGAGATLNLDGARSGRIRTRLITGVDATQTMPSSYIVKFEANDVSATVTGAGSSLYLEIRYMRSPER